MNRKDLLEKYYNEEMNRVFLASANYLMNCPKKGREREWEEATTRAEALLELMEEGGKENAKD